MYRAEERGGVHTRIGSLPTISVTYTSGERVYTAPRRSEISIVTRFRGSVLGRRRTCL